VLTVRHRVGPSSIHGLGVFAMEPVPAGAVVWRYDPMFDVEIPEETVRQFPRDLAEVVYHHAEHLPHLKVYRLGNDADIFMNHSGSPSLIDSGNEMMATHDLHIGDELTCDYSTVRVSGFFEM